jgi:hypothetical protein
MPFHLLETYIRNLSLFLFLFSPSHLEGTADGNTIRARIYARGEVSFAKFLFLPIWFAKLLEGKEQLQQFGKSTWHPSNFGKTRKIVLQ